ncbi:hypothetical protein JG687_00005220 [Phytophthora cactorum]|uniref:RxLR effector protein n=1 Tax=Phytophthora cactorum TaxID=29920 RepID=A0A8T1UR66_9STRA|nr:hypothetical protein GQ600_2280 [Phytophthora cactorum]KAG6965810.1 hypothetical protein JG687_00005220 [Phytophthora cactorum]
MNYRNGNAKSKHSGKWLKKWRSASPDIETAREDPSTENRATGLQNALVNKWHDAKKTPEDLKNMLHGVPTSGEMIDRYVKLISLSGTTS